jgi:outer membrane protein
MRRILVAVILGLLVLPTLAIAGGTKVGVVDLQQIIAKSQQGKEAMAKLKKEYEKKKAEVDKKRAEVQRMREELTKKSALLSEKAKKAKEDEYREALRQLQHLIDDSKSDLRLKENEMKQELLKQAIDVVQKMAKEKGYGLIIDMSGGVVYADKSLNISKDVLKRFDKKTK